MGRKGGEVRPAYEVPTFDTIHEVREFLGEVAFGMVPAPLASDITDENVRDHPVVVIPRRRCSRPRV